MAFFGSNYFLKRKGIPIDSHVPHEVLEEEPQYHMDPHGVPSGIARDLSSSKLNKEDGKLYIRCINLSVYAKSRRRACAVC